MWLYLCPCLWFIFLRIILKEQFSSFNWLHCNHWSGLGSSLEMRWLESTSAGLLTSDVLSPGWEESSFPGRSCSRVNAMTGGSLLFCSLGAAATEKAILKDSALCTIWHWRQASHHHSWISTLNPQLLFNLQFYSQRKRTKWKS